MTVVPINESHRLSTPEVGDVTAERDAPKSRTSDQSGFFASIYNGVQDQHEQPWLHAIVIDTIRIAKTLLAPQLLDSGRLDREEQDGDSPII